MTTRVFLLLVALLLSPALAGDTPAAIRLTPCQGEMACRVTVPALGNAEFSPRCS